MKNTYDSHIEIFKALSDINRLYIMDLLFSSGKEGEMCASTIKKDMKISQPTLSYHMKILCGCGLVNRRKNGKWVYYSLNQKDLQKMRGFFNSGSLPPA
ncbi:MAG: metalloregulator ArsR/SmtB family transcription factor [Treponema sp.]|jgi:ArsR family transcriptional regulator|nr:metalloregulator ArsR/SmtB family transcription factor [Treponema sp.]